MKPTVIPHRFHFHAASKLRASVYGAVPWVRDAKAEGWETITDGFTIRWPDGTVGLMGRPPFATEEEAQAHIDTHPGFAGYSRLGD